jgi:hypothetical protein|tara:strand:+ start:297 stop:770 length:474 start_codon:yes stop_codon:yes gene_type:complete
VLAHIAEIIGGIAIVISISYLSIQVADSNWFLRSQAHYNGLTLVRAPAAMIIENPQLSSLISRCDIDDSDLKQADLVICDNFYLMQFNALEYLYCQNIDGSIPPELWSGASAYYDHEIKKSLATVYFGRKTPLPSLSHSIAIWTTPLVSRLATPKNS